MRGDPGGCITTRDVGVMGRGTNMFRCGLVHSSGAGSAAGAVFLGTYGPPPALVWRYSPTTGELTRVAAPGEYQLDCMVEAPDGMVYLGTAYNGLVYRLDPATGDVESLGSPPIDSTPASPQAPWIFTMICTSRGEIYGAKGVGLFRLDWRQQRLEAIGVVPGDHHTLHPSRSSPIIRQLEEAPDGTIWGDTNRWLFRFHPDTGQIEPLSDMANVDPACYALFLPSGRRPSADAFFCLYSRFSGQAVRDRLYVCRAEGGEVHPVRLPRLRGDLSGHPAWWTDGQRPVLLMQTWEEERQRAHLAEVDPQSGQVLGEWSRDSHEPGGNFLMGSGREFYFFTFTKLYRADTEARRLEEVAQNPTPVECRCLAVSPRGRLGTDTYDLGYAFTLDLATGVSHSHGKVWADDHRANYGPAAFAGRTGHYFLANHGEAMPGLWVTDTHTNRHWRAGEPAPRRHVNINVQVRALTERARLAVIVEGSRDAPLTLHVVQDTRVLGILAGPPVTDPVIFDRDVRVDLDWPADAAAEMMIGGSKEAVSVRAVSPGPVTLSRRILRKDDCLARPGWRWVEGSDEQQGKHAQVCRHRPRTISSRLAWQERKADRNHDLYPKRELRCDCQPVNMIISYCFSSVNCVYGPTVVMTGHFVWRKVHSTQS